MRPTLQFALLACLATALAPAAWAQFGQPAQKRKLPPAFATGKREIEIPFSITQGTTPETQAIRVDVLISWDSGRNWFKYTEVPPDAGKFRFAAKKDMEFWFLTQTVTAAEKAPKDDAKWPQLRLIVDTQKPDLKMTALVNPSGQPELSWTVTDATLNSPSLKIEYQDASGGDDNWSTVELSSKENVVSAAGIVGKKSLKLPTGTKAINLRAEVADVAGNKSVFSQHLTLPTQPDLAAAARRENPQSQLADASARHWPEENEDPVQEQEPEPKLVTNPFAGKGRLAALPGNVEREPVRSEADLPPPEAEPLPPAQQELPREEPSTPLQPGMGRGFSNQEDIGPIGAPKRESLPATRPTRPEPETRPLPSGDSIPAGDRTRLSSAKRFNLDYDVEALGPEGIAEVELWGTNDGGKTWAKWGIDPDRASPMEVEVSREAAYGFRVVIAGKNGLVGNRPSSGDEADIWIEIDATRPAGRITTAAYGADEHSGELDIRWDAQDQHLGPRPITLSFSDRADGRFTTIAAGLPNTGQYFWRFDPRSPRQIYLKLEVRDEAGNVAADQLAEPINVEGLTPKGRIRSLTPAADPNSGSSQSFRKPLFK
ncbi:MAG: hypothetical protein IAF94_03640 [Pirellulaceae bacterium]|nr:hypothetical protein [Pirellulaceae bacterium]